MYRYLLPLFLLFAAPAQAETHVEKMRGLERKLVASCDEVTKPEPEKRELCILTAQETIDVMLKGFKNVDRHEALTALAAVSVTLCIEELEKRDREPGVEAQIQEMLTIGLCGVMLYEKTLEKVGGEAEFVRMAIAHQRKKERDI